MQDMCIEKLVCILQCLLKNTVKQYWHVIAYELSFVNTVTNIFRKYVINRHKHPPLLALKAFAFGNSGRSDQ